MKVVYCTDIHDALKELRQLLTSTEADLYLFSGDILYRAFYDDEKIYHFASLQEKLNALSHDEPQRPYPFDRAQDILRFPEKYDNSAELIATATEYRSLFDKALKTMREKYEVIFDLINKYSGPACRVLPGNYDIDFRYTVLADLSLHHKSFNYGGLNFAGYGGAPIATSGIPEKLAVVFHEKEEDGRLYSEPENFFIDSNPDVILLHNPAYGFFDRITSQGHIGSRGVRNYIDEHHPRLVLSGHIHEDYGVARTGGGTILMNPSNFGGVDSVSGYEPGGVFAEIELEPNGVQEITLRTIGESGAVDLMTIDCLSDRLVATKQADGIKHHLDLSRFIRDAYGRIID